MTTPTLPAKRRGRNGRPSKFTPELVRRVIRCVRGGMPLTLAANASGICYLSLTEYRKRYPQFDIAMNEAIAAGIKKRLDVVLKATRSQDEAVRLRAACWWLTHVPPAAQHFSESSRLEVTGNGLHNQIAVLLWPHQQANEEIPDATDHHPAETSSDPD